jgi:predicted flap endonuclease-1-like 5' DNA nuclease
MNTLLLQTFLLVLASYFLGAVLACIVKRAVMATRAAEPAEVRPPATAAYPTQVAYPTEVRTPPPAAHAPVPPPLRPPVPPPRPAVYTPPRIDVVARPDPRPMPKLVDPKRFERALMGPELNEGMPRKAIVEIRPRVLKSPTRVIARPVAPTPNAEPPPPIVEPPATATVEAPAPAPVASVKVTPSKSEAAPPRRSALSDATTSAAAGAVAMAKAAAAASIAVFSRPAAQAKQDPAKASPEAAAEPAPETTAGAEKEPEQAKPSAKAPKTEAAAKPAIEGGDDLQRIRAIDAAVEAKLKKLGVNYFEHIAAWTNSDVKKISQSLGISGRIDREQWVEQAQILAKGGETYYSRNRLAAQKAATQTSQAEKASEPAAEPKDTVPATSAETMKEAAATSPPQTTKAQNSSQLSGVAAAIHGRSVAEMASAAAAAVAAASASVTRGFKPIEPISPLSRVDPKISLPAKLTDAIRERVAAVNAQSEGNAANLEVVERKPATSGHIDDLKRIRGIGVLIEKRLNAMGVTRYEHIANWTSGDIDRVSQVLEFGGRIEREAWVEQARILSSGGQTEFSRRVDRGEFDTSRET